MIIPRLIDGAWLRKFKNKNSYGQDFLLSLESSLPVTSHSINGYLDRLFVPLGSRLEGRVLDLLRNLASLSFEFDLINIIGQQISCGGDFDTSCFDDYVCSVEKLLNPIRNRHDSFYDSYKELRECEASNSLVWFKSFFKLNHVVINNDEGLSLAS